VVPHPIKIVIVGYGNPYCGDDGVGPAAARLVHATLAEETGASLLELSTSSLELIERLAGFDRAVIIDALVDEAEPLGAVKRLELVDGRAIPGLGFHTAGLGSALALARALGMDAPASVGVYGVVIREPREFQERLGDELSSLMPEVVRTLTELIREEAARPV
jgi:hydrogenase maturation protease